LEQWRNVAVIGKSESVDIGFSDSRALSQIGSPPGKFLGAIEPQEQIASQSCPSTIAIGEWVNERQPMMETNGAFVEQVTLVSELRLDVLAEIVELRRDLVSQDAYVLLREAERAGPLPNLVEHLLM
jgi:hypothetical protein